MCNQQKLVVILKKMTLVHWILMYLDMNSNNINTKEQHNCVGCKRIFKSSRAISSYWQLITECCNQQKDYLSNYFEDNDSCSLNFDVFEMIKITTILLGEWQRWRQ
jgi:hypothetical protein